MGFAVFVVVLVGDALEFFAREHREELPADVEGFVYRAVLVLVLRQEFAFEAASEFEV